MALHGTNQVLVRGSWKMGLADVFINIGNPIGNTKGRKVAELKDEIRDCISSLKTLIEAQNEKTDKRD